MYPLKLSHVLDAGKRKRIFHNKQISKKLINVKALNNIEFGE